MGPSKIVTLDLIESFNFNCTACSSSTIFSFFFDIFWAIFFSPVEPKYGICTKDAKRTKLGEERNDESKHVSSAQL